MPARSGTGVRALSPLRRRATLVATVLDTITRLTDDGVALFDRAVGRMFRRAEVARGGRRAARRPRDQRQGAPAGQAGRGADRGQGRRRRPGARRSRPPSAGTGWRASVAEAERLARPDKADLPALAARAWPVLHRLGPLFLGAFRLRAVPAAAGDAARGRGCCAASTAAAAGRGRAACRPASSGRPGATRCWAPAGRRAPHLGGGHPARVARPAARRRHLGRGQPAVARRRGPAHPARPVRRHARGRAAARRRARDRGGVPRRAPRPAGAAPRRGRRQGRGGRAGGRPDQGRRAEDHAAQGGHAGGGRGRWPSGSTA